MTKQNRATRREFLKLAATSAPAAVVLATSAESQAAEPDLDTTTLQDTAHARAYYASARF